MALTSTVEFTLPLASGWHLAFGYATQAKADSGGDIDTGLRLCKDLRLFGNSTAVSASWAVVNEPAMISGDSVAGNAVTIVTAAGVRYLRWIAFGRE
jgi:hypothetical protein